MEHRLFVKRPVLPLFSEGKDLEVRVSSTLCNSVVTGDTMVFNDTLKRKVVEIRRYPDFAQMLKVEDYRRLYPKAESGAWLLQALCGIYRKNQEIKGVLIFELERT